jgi:hypothetical protein
MDNGDLLDGLPVTTIYSAHDDMADMMTRARWPLKTSTLTVLIWPVRL